MRYLPHTPEEVAQMLEAIGAGSISELFESIPPEARFTRDLDVPSALDEPSLMAHMRELSEQSAGAALLSFLGGGMYAHHIPPAVDQLLLRSEFYTAYTPYQPEVAQGTLQVIWEFQTLVSELFGLPLANASLYDGASGVAEAALMARRLTKRGGVVMSGCVNPDGRAVTRTYLSGTENAPVKEVPHAGDGGFDIEALTAAITDDTAAVIVGYPGFYGTVKDLAPLAERAHAAGALLVASVSDPYALALIKPPGELGADIAIAEGQPLACPPQFGGPGVGLFACRNERKYLQQLPGRVCGRTTDADGETGYVLTLSTREQHIRRERATSNICTNQGLIALALTIRASMLGKTGFVQTAEQCVSRARYLQGKILELPGFSAGFDSACTFNEFAVKVRGGDAAKVCQALESKGIVAGLDLGRVDPEKRDLLLIAVTELHSRKDMDAFVSALSAV